METLTLIGCILAGCLVLAALTTIYACVVVSGRCSRQERAGRL